MDNMQMPLSLAVGATDQGRVKKSNEDNYVINQRLGLCMVIDGMGGHDHGVMATQMIGDHFQSQLEQRLNHLKLNTKATDDDWVNQLDNVISDTNLALYKKNQALGYSPGRGMGGVIAGLLWVETGRRAIVFHAGDSRLYRYRNQQLSQITEDHSWYQQWLNQGRVGQAPAKNFVLRAVGPSDDVKADFQFVNFEDDDVILICSDGLTSMVSDSVLQEMIKGVACSEAFKELPQAMIQRANDEGGKDNITAIIIASDP